MTQIALAIEIQSLRDQIAEANRLALETKTYLLALEVTLQDLNARINKLIESVL